MSKNFTFNNAPSIQMKRSRIGGLSYGVNSSLSMGRLIPFYNEEVLPGDTFKVNSEMVIRLTSSFIKPIYGNLFADVFYFFVPWRLVFDDYSCVFGDNKDGYWANPQVYEIPHAYAQTCYSKSLADYLEMPVGAINAPVNILYHRATALIWNDWVRDENYQEPVFIHKGAFDGSESLNGGEWSVNNYTGMCPPVSKYKDYFTSVLPSAQKGDPVSLAFGAGDIAVRTSNTLNTVYSPSAPLRFVKTDGTSFDSVLGSAPLGINYGANTNISTLHFDEYNAQETSYYGDTALVPANLVVNLDSVKPVTVNDLRLAFQTQKILERDALGTRYVEHIFNTFGVSNPDSRLQRPELLNAARIPINVQQVASTTSNNTATPSSQLLAKLGAYSLTSGKSGFTKAFSEYGCVIGFICIRQFHSYSQGMPKRFTRFKRLDYYNPALAYVGMMPVKTTEIYAQAPSTDIFGYQRPWSEYRHHQNAITGEMRSGSEKSLDIWHIGDEYASQPYAGSEFITETPNNLNRVITVNSEVQDQFIIDVWHNVDAVRVMPANPMPGLIDHY